VALSFETEPAASTEKYYYTNTPHTECSTAYTFSFLAQLDRSSQSSQTSTENARMVLPPGKQWSFSSCPIFHIGKES